MTVTAFYIDDYFHALNFGRRPKDSVTEQSRISAGEITVVFTAFLTRFLTEKNHRHTNRHINDFLNSNLINIII